MTDTTEAEDLVLRVAARLVSVSVEGSRATITLLAERSPALQRLVRESGESCLVGFVFESAVTPPPDE